MTVDKTDKTLPIARLTGVIENPGEHTPCSLIFVLETEQGHTINLSYALLMQGSPQNSDRKVR